MCILFSPLGWSYLKFKPFLLCTYIAIKLYDAASTYVPAVVDMQSRHSHVLLCQLTVYRPHRQRDRFTRASRLQPPRPTT